MKINTKTLHNIQQRSSERMVLLAGTSNNDTDNDMVYPLGNFRHSFFFLPFGIILVVLGFVF